MKNVNQLSLVALFALASMQGTLALPPNDKAAPISKAAPTPVPQVAVETSEQMKGLKTAEAKEGDSDNSSDFETALKLHEDAIKNYEEAITNLQKQYADYVASTTDVDYQINTLRAKMDEAHKAGDNDQQRIDSLASKLDHVANKVIENDSHNRERVVENAYSEFKKKDQEFQNQGKAGLRSAESQANAVVTKKMAEDAAKEAEASRQKLENLKKLYGQ